MNLQLIRIKRSCLWLSSLILTLTKFWIKHPEETPAIIQFIFAKAAFVPKFLNRNIRTEEYSQQFSETLDQATKLYRKFGASFNPRSQTSYKKLLRLVDVDNRYIILYFLVRKLKPKTIVETGVAAGVSSGYLLQAIHDNKQGKLYSIDLPFQWYLYGNHQLHLDSLPVGKSPGYLIPDSLKKNWSLTLGDTYQCLPKLLKKLGTIDMFFHDSEHSLTTMLFEYNLAWPKIKKTGILGSDDISFTNAFTSFSKTNQRIAYYFDDLGIIFK